MNISKSIQRLTNIFLFLFIALSAMLVHLQKFLDSAVDLFWLLLLYPVAAIGDIFDLEIGNPCAQIVREFDTKRDIVFAPDQERRRIHAQGAIAVQALTVTDQLAIVVKRGS